MGNEEENLAKIHRAEEQEKIGEVNIVHRVQELKDQQDRTAVGMKTQEYGSMPQGATQNDMLLEEGTQVTKEEDDLGNKEQEEREVDKEKE